MVKVQDSKLGKGKAKVIAFVSESIFPTQVSKTLDYAATYAQERRSCTMRFAFEDLSAQPNIFDGCDGILADVIKQETIELPKATGLPVVMTTINDNPDIACVDFSPEMAGAMAAEWFLRRRFTNFAFCGTHGNLFYDRLAEAFSAVFCIHDRRAALVIESCLRVGRAVPDDIAVMGRHNDIILCAYSPRAITSIDPNFRLQTYTAYYGRPPSADRRN